MPRQFKIATVLAAVLFSGGILTTHITGTLYPGLPFGFVLAILMLFGGTFASRTSATAGVATFVALGTLYHGFAFLFPASMISFDPDAHAVASQTIVSTGGLSDLADGFYAVASLFRMLGAQVALLLNVPIDQAYVIYPLAVPTVLALAAAVLARRISLNPIAAVIAAGIVTVAAPVTKFTIAPIPLSLAALYMTTAIMILSNPSPKLDERRLLMVLILAVAAGFTHKVPLLLLFGVTTAVYVIKIGFDHIFSGGRPSDQNWSLPLVIGALLAIQWIYLTTFGAVATFLLLGTRSLGSTPADPLAAVRLTPPLVIRLANVSYFFLMIALGGVVGLWLLRLWRRRDVQVLLAAAGITVLFALPGTVVSSAPGFQRVFVYAAPFVAALIGVGAAYASRADSRRNVVLPVIIIGFVFISNPLAPIATPDHPSNPRQYLTAEEVAGKQFANDRIEDVVYMDLFFGDEVVDFQAAASGPTYNQRTVPNPKWYPGLLNSELYNRTLINRGYRYVAVRTHIDIYRLGGGKYRLTWSPKASLDRSYNAVYDSGGVRIYKHA